MVSHGARNVSIRFCYRSVAVVGSARIHDDQQRVHGGQLINSGHGRHNRAVQR